jgi:hypothetical protein
VSTITSANASFIITPRLAGLIGVGLFAVQGFASDDAFATDTVDSAEARMGVDGHASFGYLPRLTKQTITLQADSPSIPLFEQIVAAQDIQKEVVLLDGILTLRSVNHSYALVKGALTRITVIPPAKKVLEPVTYEITWELIQPAPVA